MGLTVGVKARPVGNAPSLLRSHVLPVSETHTLKSAFETAGRIFLEPESDGFLFVRVSLTKCLKRANESGAYPAKLLLDGAESAQIFYDTPVMRFYIDPTAVCGIARCSSPSFFFFFFTCSGTFSHAIYFSLPHSAWTTARADRWQSSARLSNIITYSRTPLFSWFE